MSRTEQIIGELGTVHRVDHEERKVYVDRTKEQIKNAPEYDPDADADEHRRRTGDYYTEGYRLSPPVL
ncbi:MULTISPECIES: hypothetical protein [unclassified Saccharothrix]|uniref:hypothetical protein n=1 Tax=unclassified Saccharothrix TaxID=2593673 RepID=UPI00307D2D57